MLKIIGILITIAGLLLALFIEYKKKKEGFEYNLNFGSVVTVLGLVIFGIGLVIQSNNDKENQAIKEKEKVEQKIQNEREDLKKQLEKDKEKAKKEKINRIQKERDKKYEEEKKKSKEESKNKEENKEEEKIEDPQKIEDKMAYNAALTKAQAWKEKVMFGVYPDLCNVDLNFDQEKVTIQFIENNPVDEAFYSGDQLLWDEQKLILANSYNELVENTSTQFQLNVISQSGEVLLEVYGPNNVVDHFTN